MLPWLLCGILVIVVLALYVRLRLLQKDLDDIGRQLAERLSADTNNPIFLSTRDAHARKLAADLNAQLKELRRQRQRYENGDRELKEAVTNVSHDLRTPLTAISGYLDLLDREDAGQKARRCLAVIRERVDTLTGLTGELLRYSIVTAPANAPCPRPISLNAALEQSVAALYGAFIQRGIRPAISMPGEPVERSLDPAALARVLGNILSNALKHSAGDLDITLTPEGVFTFSNSAPDLTPLDAERLFDRFYTVSSPRGSTGLGLSIAKTLTRQMGGTIGAICRDGRFTLTLSFPAQPQAIM